MIKSRVHAFCKAKHSPVSGSTTNLTNTVFVTCLCNFRCILILQKKMDKQEKMFLGIQKKNIILFRYNNKFINTFTFSTR